MRTTDEARNALFDRSQRIVKSGKGSLVRIEVYTLRDLLLDFIDLQQYQMLARPIIEKQGQRIKELEAQLAASSEIGGDAWQAGFDAGMGEYYDGESG